MSNKPDYHGARNNRSTHVVIDDYALKHDWRAAVDPREYDAIGTVRARLELDDEISDLTIGASLAVIAGKGDPRARWLAAFTSPLGKRLAARGGDLNTALNVMMAHAPKSS